jgi:uncharacterized membrane protein
MTAKEFFSIEDLEIIKTAIMDAELNTSGEIRVHLENICNEDPMKRAFYWFHKLNMKKTQQRNALLFYFAVKSRKFAIIGDKAIHEAVKQEFWDILRNKMLQYFHNDDFLGGLTQAIERAGKEMKKYFPFQQDTIDELPNDVSLEDN